MEISSIHKALFLEILLSPLLASGHLKTLKESLDTSPLLPSNFLFGTASSFYQFEGAFISDGKGLNNWDVYTHKPGTIIDGSNGDVAVGHYHRYLEDIDLMDSLGVNSYRFSISWARILPKGRFGDVNLAGIDYYNKLIDALLLKDICFKSFDDRVKYWVTFNEPNILVIAGYRSGEYPPSRCSGWFGNCTSGDSEKEPFVAAHNIILSHASAVDIYRTKYQKEQNGSIGIVVHAVWYEPISNSTADLLAAEKAQSFFMNWFLDPIIFGKYHVEMKKILGPTLPEFSSSDREKLKKGLDFIGINHYTSFYVQDCIFSECEAGRGVSKTEGFYLQTSQKDGLPIGESTTVDWLCLYPQGMEKIVTYKKERYGDIPMFITENGFGEKDNPNSTIETCLKDVKRLEYMSSHLDALVTAVRKGADVRGYFAWSLLDNFEWKDGYTIRFGLHHVDYATLRRTPRLSATWYKQYIANHTTQNLSASE
ncbi:hypothetical protein L1049_009936 [Liquidambar formosana]|uniref:Uncharacterized protein n=1 Tax=Liquidambar formosana TaxID=63359 RepID=A0AAP0R4F9_LIQFO